MKTGSSAPRVWLNPVAVWDLLARPTELSWNDKRPHTWRSG